MRYFITADARRVSTVLRKAQIKAAGETRRAFISTGFKATSAYSSHCEVRFQGHYDNEEAFSRRIDEMAQVLRIEGFLVERWAPPHMPRWPQLHVWTEAKTEAQMDRFWANPDYAKVITDLGIEMDALDHPDIKAEVTRRERAENRRQRAEEARVAALDRRLETAVAALRDMGFSAQETTAYGQHRVTISLEDAEALVAKLQ